MGSPLGYAIDAAAAAGSRQGILLNSDLLPMPSDTVAAVMDITSYSFVSIPYRSEFKDFRVSFIILLLVLLTLSITWTPT